MGASRCTCWEEVYDLEQQPQEVDGDPRDLATTRKKCCHDCAYRSDSPEKARGEAEVLEGYAEGERSEFWCHQGIRRIIGWRHPDGRYVEAPPGCYDPPGREHGVLFKADGKVGERCAGWAAHKRSHVVRESA